MKLTNPDEVWRLQKVKLLLRFSHLVEEDFRYDYGMKEVMMNKLQAKLGKSRDEFNAILAAL
jgi:hypothetical protein